MSTDNNIAHKISAERIATELKPLNRGRQEALPRNTDLKILIIEEHPDDLNKTIVYKNGNQEITMQRFISFYASEHTKAEKHEESGMDIIPIAGDRKTVYELMTEQGKMPKSFKLVEQKAYAGATPNYIESLGQEKETTLEAYKAKKVDPTADNFPLLKLRNKKTATDPENWFFVPVTMVQLTW